MILRGSVTFHVTCAGGVGRCGKLSAGASVNGLHPPADSLPITYMNPDPKHVKEVFWTRYYEEHKTYDGVRDAFVWWSDPGLKCLIEESSGGKRCTKPCDMCKARRINESVRRSA